MLDQSAFLYPDLLDLCSGLPVEKTILQALGLSPVSPKKTKPVFFRMGVPLFFLSDSDKVFCIFLNPNEVYSSCNNKKCYKCCSRYTVDQ